MLDLKTDTAARIIDALALAIDGKVSSAKPFKPTPYSDLASYGDWGQENNDNKNDTPRTRALLLAYLIFSGGRIPLLGIQIDDAYLRPDLWVAGALVKKGYVTVDDGDAAFVMTAKGWDFVAETLEGHLLGPGAA